MFKVGDRVECRDHSLLRGGPKIGTVRFADGPNLGVEFDEHVHGHNLGGTCKEGYGWWVSAHSCYPATLDPFDQAVHEYIRGNLLPD